MTPASFSETFAPGDTMGSYNMTIAKHRWWCAAGSGGIQEADPNAVRYGYGLSGGGEITSVSESDRASKPVVAARAVRSSHRLSMQPFRVQDRLTVHFAEAFDDITLLPGAGWALQKSQRAAGNFGLVPRATLILLKLIRVIQKPISVPTSITRPVAPELSVTG